MGLGFGMDWLAGLSEGKPNIPAFKPVDVGAEQAKATQQNLDVLPKAEELASQTNAFNQSEIEKMLRQAIPMYDTLKGDTSAQIDRMLRGELPTSDVAQSQLGSVAKAFGLGTPGGAGPLVARDLGLKQLAEVDKGLDAAGRWMTTMANIERPGFFDVTRMFVTPEFETNVAISERDKQFQHDYVSNMNDWQHSMGFLWGQDMRNTGETIKSLLQAYAGAAGCWVAREVYGAENPRWLLFRGWLFNKAPGWFKRLYLSHGKRFACFIANKPLIKAALRRWMDSRISKLTYGTF